MLNVIFYLIKKNKLIIIHFFFNLEGANYPKEGLTVYYSFKNNSKDLSGNNYDATEENIEYSKGFDNID